MIPKKLEHGELDGIFSLSEVLSNKDSYSFNDGMHKFLSELFTQIESQSDENWSNVFTKNLGVEVSESMDELTLSKTGKHPSVYKIKRDIENDIHIYKYSEDGLQTHRVILSKKAHNSYFKLIRQAYIQSPSIEAEEFVRNTKRLVLEIFKINAKLD